jgi:hypothetical protein
MPDQKKPAIDLHMDNAPQFLAFALKQPSVIVITRDADGVASMSSNGVRHAIANEMLSVGIYSNLDQHYQQIRDGAAGTAAKEKQAEIDHSNKEAA